MLKVSILLPTLNSRTFLEARLESIAAQTMKDWELVVVDSGSEDGSWEILQEWARRDSRMRLHQNQQRGIYVNLNHCVTLARGEHVYFAMSDDLMTPDCCEKLSAALDAHRECDLAHCKLCIIDEAGQPVGERRAWDNFFLFKHYAQLMEEPHIRLAPHDGILHFSGITVYTSLTQLLIRRALFEKIGLFLTTEGSMADYEWCMRAGLVVNTVHVPECMASWRVHGLQATGGDALRAAQGAGRFVRMAKRAVHTARRLAPEKLVGFRMRDADERLQREYFFFQLHRHDRRLWKISILLLWLLRRPSFVRQWLDSKRSGQKFLLETDRLAFVQRLDKMYGLRNYLCRLPAASEARTRSLAPIQ